MSDYFRRVRKNTCTQFYINNATREQVRFALDAGATGCTNNPSFTWKILSNEAERAYFQPLLDAAIRDNPDDNAAECALQMALVRDVAALFYPQWKESHGRYGYVSIQGDPVHEHDPDVILREGRVHRELSPNVCCKIPVTKAGLTAMEQLLRENTPINATEIMSISQGLSVCELYARVYEETGARPPLFLSFISGILNEYLRKQFAKGCYDIDPDVLWQAGTAACRKMHRLIQERNDPIVMISGGVRENADFTDFVGGNIAVTVNWLGNGSASSLLEADPRVVSLINAPVPDTVLDELRRKLPEFVRAYDIGALAVDEYADFGPVDLFRSNFLTAWDKALAAIAKRRAEM